MRRRTKMLLLRLLVIVSRIGIIGFLAWKGWQMAFKVIKEWLFSGLRRGRSKHGQLVVSSQGECTIVVPWTPTKVTVFFTDAEPPIDTCHPHPHDTLDDDLIWLGHGKWGIKIKWNVYGTRHVKYEIEGHA